MFDAQVILPKTETIGDIEKEQAEEGKRAMAKRNSDWSIELAHRWSRFLRKIDSVIPIYAIRNVLFAPQNRSNLLRIPTMNYEYADPVERILHANMAVLVDFIEKEEPFKYINWNATPEHRRAADEMLEIYRWWKYDPFARELGPENFYQMNYREVLEWARTIYKPEDNWIEQGIERSKNPGTFWFDIENEAEDRRTAMMIRLAKIRRYLWT